MRPPRWIRRDGPPEVPRIATPGPRRETVAALLALVTAIWLGAMFYVSKGQQFLMPGPLSSAHGGMENCNDCHTKSGNGKLTWTHGLVSGNPQADSKACLTCHKMPETAFNPHSATADVLRKSTERLTKVAATIPQPHSARAQNAIFPTEGVMAKELYCATCHQEHQGVNFKLSQISNEQCRSCHVVKFDSFDGNHPKFDSYPFKRRTRVIFDHNGHFGKHYPEVAKKDPAKRVPETCSTCHDSRDDKRVMAVASFDKTCSTCHLDQIIGKERASGPKGIAFLTLPGIDLQALKQKNAPIGEWPDGSDAALTPFMKVMISRTKEGRTLLKKVDGLNMQDLSSANDEQITAVTDLAWEIKALFHTLIKGKASDVLGDLNIGGGAKLSPALVADLTASIPRDVIMSAQQQWLPNLAAEMVNPKVPLPPVTAPPSADAEAEKPSGEEPSTAATEPEEPGSSDESEDAGKAEEDDKKKAEDTRPRFDPPPCLVRVLGQCLVSKEQKLEKKEEAKDPSVATDASETNGSATPSVENSTEPAKEDLPGKMNAGLRDAGKVAEMKVAQSAEADKAGGAPAQSKGDQTDDLLNPTEEELRAIKAAQPQGGFAKGGKPAASGGASAGAATGPGGAPQISIDSDVDPESWAEYGGWYRQDFAILYRPAGHKDKFIYSWLFLTGPQATKDQATPASAVFNYLTSKDAQGSCTKCHSVDDLDSKGRLVNFSPTKVESKQGRFTHFIHEPHFAILEDRRAGAQENRGCLTCHSLEKPQVSNTAAVEDPAITTQGATPPSAPSADPGTAASAPANDTDKTVRPQGAGWTTETVEAKPDDGGAAATPKSEAAPPSDAAAKPAESVPQQPAEPAAQPGDAAAKPAEPAVQPSEATPQPAEAPPGTGSAPANNEAEKAVSPYLKSYEQGNPHKFVSSFGSVKKDLCQTCHTSTMARQDCLLCHKYHVNGVVTPITNTKLPIQ